MSVDPVTISRSALDVEWQRMQVIAQNLANENSVGIAGQPVFRPRRLLSAPKVTFDRIVEGAKVAEPRGVEVRSIFESAEPARRVYDPSHPAADNAGYVRYPAVDHAEEMVALTRSARAYESNLTVLGLVQQMTMRALEIGKR